MPEHLPLEEHARRRDAVTVGRAQGLSMREIAEQIDVAPAALQAWMATYARELMKRPRPTPTIDDPELRRAMVITGREAGKPDEAIAEELGLTLRGMRRWLTASARDLRRDTESEWSVRLAALQEAEAQGLTMTDAAHTIGIAPGTLIPWARRHGVDFRPSRGNWARGPRRSDPLAVMPVKRVESYATREGWRTDCLICRQRYRRPSQRQPDRLGAMHARLHGLARTFSRRGYTSWTHAVPRAAAA